jgi:hypothetical protein
MKVNIFQEVIKKCIDGRYEQSCRETSGLKHWFLMKFWKKAHFFGDGDNNLRNC